MSRSRAKTRRPKNSQPLADAEASEFFAEQDEAAAPATPATPEVPDASAASGIPVTSHSPLTELADPDATRETVAEPRTPAVPKRRTWRARAGQAGYTIAPYWFVGSGLALGIGGVVQDQPLAGACGAVAGVAAGLIYQNRARYYHRQAEALRERLRAHRIEAEANATQLRETLRSLRTEVWELRFAQQISLMDAQLTAARMFEPEEKAQIATLATQPLDFSELRTSWMTPSTPPEVVPSAEPLVDTEPEPESVADTEPEVDVEPVDVEPVADDHDGEDVPGRDADAGAETDDQPTGRPENEGARVIDLRGPNSSGGQVEQENDATGGRRAATG